MLLDCNQYYIYNNFRYHLNFPIIWAMTHLKDTGPHCLNCLAYGTELSINNELVFIGYCMNCSIHVYKKRRSFYINEEYDDMDDPESNQENPFFKDGYDSY
mgnify:CR=1 FL=1